MIEPRHDMGKKGQHSVQSYFHKKAPREESVVQRVICDYLKLKGHFFTRVNNIPVHRRAMPKYTLKGFPDILVISEGRPIGIEVKKPGSKQSPDQEEFQERWEENGGIYFVACSLDDVINWGL